MTTEETEMLIELKNALSDTLIAVKQAFENSGYYQLCNYKTNDNVDNWLSKSTKILNKVNSHFKNKEK